MTAQSRAPALRRQSGHPDIGRSYHRAQPLDGLSKCRDRHPRARRELYWQRRLCQFLSRRAESRDPPPGGQWPAPCEPIIRIVDGTARICPQINNFVTARLHHFGDFSLEWKSAVITSKGNSHRKLGTHSGRFGGFVSLRELSFACKSSHDNSFLEGMRLHHFHNEVFCKKAPSRPGCHEWGFAGKSSNFDELTPSNLSFPSNADRQHGPRRGLR